MIIIIQWLFSICDLFYLFNHFSGSSLKGALYVIVYCTVLGCIGSHNIILEDYAAADIVKLSVVKRSALFDL